MKLRLTVLAASLLFAGSASAQTVLYVDNARIPLGTGPTCSNAFPTIDAALAAAAFAVQPVEIRVAGAAGGRIYQEPLLELDLPNLRISGGWDSATFTAGCTDLSVVQVLDRTRTVIDARQQHSVFDVDCVRDGNGFCIGRITGVDLAYLTMRNGRPTRAIDPLNPARVGGSGGAMRIVNGEVRVSNSVIENNSSTPHLFGGGAFYVVGYFTATNNQFNTARLTLDSNLIQNNNTGDGFSSSGSGGAILAIDDNFDGAQALRSTFVDATRNTFLRNTAQGAGLIPVLPNCQAFVDDSVPPDGVPDRAVPNWNYDCNFVDDNGDGFNDDCMSTALGGAAFLVDVQGTWTDNLLDTNAARGSINSGADHTAKGGALAVRASASPNQGNPRITNNRFFNNTAAAGTSSSSGCGYYNGWGGALYLSGFDGIIDGVNIFANNRAVGTGNAAPQTGIGGGILMFPQNRPRIEDNLFIDAPGGGNQAIAGGGAVSGHGGGVAVAGGQPVITNNTFRGNTAQTGSPGIVPRAGTGYGGGLAGLGLVGAYPEITGNTFENNTARSLGTRPAPPTPPPLVPMGGGAFIEIASADALVADNVFRANIATPVGTTGPVAFAGVVFQAQGTLSTGASAVSEGRIQNNLFAENEGIGVMLFGDQQDAGGTPVQHVFTAQMLNNTIVDNLTGGLVMNRADDTVLDSNIIVRNGGGLTDFGDIQDELFTTNPPQGPSDGLVLRYNDIGILPAGPPELLAQATDGIALSPPQDWVGEDPLFATGPVAPYYLRQPGEEIAPWSELVDAGPVLASARDFGGPRLGADYDLDGDTVEDTMADRTTRSRTQGPDLCFLDIGFHFRMGAPLPDFDGDTVPDSFEDLDNDSTWDVGVETNFRDRDTDDDGVLDAADCGLDVDGDGTIAALDCDSDGDGLTDGLEMGVNTQDVGTVIVPNGCTSVTPCGTIVQNTFVPDAQPSSRTDPLNPDTDGGGDWDGCEDANHNGQCQPCGLPCSGATTEQNPQAAAAGVPGPGDDDADEDCMQLSFERSLGLDPLDADTDDDGIADGIEYDFGVNPPRAQEDLSEPLLCDTDGDGLPDGLEQSDVTGCDTNGDGISDCTSPFDPTCDLNSNSLPDDCQAFVAIAANVDPGGRWSLGGTDLAAGCFDADLDPTTQTETSCPTPGSDCPGFDTDGDTCADGVEDANGNGRVDVTENDPNVADCGPTAPPLRVNEEITDVSDPSVPATCGPQTVPPEYTIMDQRDPTPCGNPTVNCLPGFRIATVLRCTPGANVPAFGPVVGTPVTIAGAATQGAGCPLTFFEMDTCATTLWVLKDGVDIVLEAR